MNIYAHMWDYLWTPESNVPRYADLTPEQRAAFDASCQRENEFHARVADFCLLGGLTYEQAYEKAQLRSTDTGRGSPVERPNE